MGVASLKIPFIHVLLLNYRFNNNKVFHVHANAQASLRNVIMI